MNQQNPFVYEIPLVVLIQSLRVAAHLYFAALVLFSFCLGIILPVLQTGDYNTLGTEHYLISNIMVFYGAWLVAIILSGLLFKLHTRHGIYYFYSDRVEFRAYFNCRKIVIPYNRMYVIKEGSLMTMTVKPLPGRSYPLQRFKERFGNGLGINTDFDKPVRIGSFDYLPGWKNPEDGPKAVQIIREKAFSFIEEDNNKKS